MWTVIKRIIIHCWLNETSSHQQLVLFQAIAVVERHTPESALLCHRNHQLTNPFKGWNHMDLFSSHSISEDQLRLFQITSKNPLKAFAFDFVVTKYAHERVILDVLSLFFEVFWTRSPLLTEITADSSISFLFCYIWVNN